jgi:NADPH-dependent 2,4-dienoyl-CoA reductase/sulfur reductase-like enzyme
LSKGVGVNVDDILLRPAGWFEAADIEVRLNTRVASIDVSSKTAVVQGGGTVTYDGILVATGSAARRLSVPGAELLGIHTLRNPEDAAALSEAVGCTGSKHVVIVGSSFIGMEYAASLASSGLAKSITVVGMEKTPFERILGSQVGSFVQSKLEAKGVSFELEASLSQFAGQNGQVCRVELAGGKSLEADVVILGVGAQPQHPVLGGLGGASEQEDGSLATNETFQLAVASEGGSQPAIWAAGDVASFPSPSQLGSLIRIEHWSVAQQQGRVAAKNMLDHFQSQDQATPVASQHRSAMQAQVHVPFFWTALSGIGNIRYVGSARNGFDKVSFLPNSAPVPSDDSFVACYEADGAVVAVATFGADPVATNARVLLSKKESFNLEAFLCALEAF